MALSDAFKGYSYQGAFGNDLQAVANMGAGLAKGRALNEEAKRQAALEAAMQKLKQDQFALDQRQVEQGDTRIQLDRDRMAQDAAEAERQRQQAGFEAQMDEIDAGVERGSREEQAGLNRESAERIARINAQGRLDVARERGGPSAGSGRDYVIKESSDGRVWRVNKLTGMADEVRIAEDGSTTLIPATDADKASVQEAVGRSGPQMLGAGARPSEGEKTAEASYSNLQDAFERLKENMATVAFQPPGVGEQFLIDGSKTTGLGPISSLVRSLSNVTLGNTSPAYQSIQQSVDALGTMVVKMVTGAQMSEPEAQRIMNILRTLPGDNPQLVQQRLQQVQEIIDNEKVKVGRAGSTAWQAGAVAAPSQGFNGQMVDRGAAIKAKYNLE